MEAQIEVLFAQAPLYAILDTAVHPDLAPMAILEALEALEGMLRAGVRVVQYRHKGPFRRTHFQQCCLMAERVHQSGGMFIINDRADVAALCGADGVHLGQDDLPPEKARSLLGAGKRIGYSTHNREQVALAADQPVDYIAIGPIFATSTKRNPDPAVGLGMISAVRALTAKPLVAIGGITLENAPSALAAGADAVAVISDLLLAPDVESRARQFLAALKTARFTS